MKKIIFILFLLTCSAFQIKNYTLIKKIPCPASFITTDNIGNLYLVVNNELRKYDSDGNLLKTFSDKSHGSLTFIDVSDPLKILLFYHDFRQIVFLDNMLSSKSDAILIDDLEVLQPLLLCSSYDNGFWIYDQQDFQLTRFDKNLQKSNQSGNISQLTGIEIKPNFLTEVSDKLYLNDPEKGIFIFDKYGTYAKTLPFKKLSSFQIINDNILYSNDSSLIRYNCKTFELQSSGLPVKNVVNARYVKDRIYIQDSTSVQIYTSAK